MIVLAIVLSVANVRWPLDDFVEYWAAGRLNVAGANPYDPAAVLREQVGISWTEPEPLMMYNPPWTLALAMPVGAVEFRLARSIWLPLQLFLTLWCASRLWLLYGGAPEHVTRAWFVALLWTPTMLALRFGQLSPVMLFGLVGFLWCVLRKRDFAAGACLALTAVKPQLVALAALLTQTDRRSVALAAGALLLAVSALSFVMHARRVPQAAFLWMTPAVALAWWTMRPANAHSSHEEKVAPCFDT